MPENTDRKKIPYLDTSHACSAFWCPFLEIGHILYEFYFFYFIVNFRIPKFVVCAQNYFDINHGQVVAESYFYANSSISDVELQEESIVSRKKGNG